MVIAERRNEEARKVGREVQKEGRMGGTEENSGGEGCEVERIIENQSKQQALARHNEEVRN